MATITRTIAERDIPAAETVTSISGPVPGRIRDIAVRLSSSEWAAKAGSGVVIWGVQRSDDDGTTWGPGLADNAPIEAARSIPAWLYTANVIGDTYKGQLPAMRFSSDQLDIVQESGVLVRLFAYTTAALALGATITAERP